ncbi:MAG: hypothetical protein LBJ20_01295 [Candidatus Methanoplasma sp.]|nr:hypothetical protein [Candidatus Methanoplasma sp.]
MGHTFVTFLSLCIWTEISRIIESAGMSSSHTVTDVLDSYASVKRISSGGGDLRQTIEKDILDLDQKLWLFVYSEEKILHKRGRKPKVWDI